MRTVRLEPLLPTDQPSAEVAGDIVRNAVNGSLVAEQVSAVVEGQLALYGRTSAAFPWIGYLAHDQRTGELVGSCSFIANDPGGSIEIAYFTFPPFEGSGVATAMARELVNIAADAGNPDLHAFTLPEANASTRILQKLGFTQAGEAQDDDAGTVWRWERRSPPRQ